MRCSKRMHIGIIRSILDIIVLQVLKEESQYGNRVVTNLKTKFGIKLSPSTVYPLLKSLKEKKFIKIESVQNSKICFGLTESGEEYRKQRLHDYMNMDELIRAWLKE